MTFWPTDNVTVATWVLLKTPAGVVLAVTRVEEVRLCREST